MNSRTNGMSSLKGKAVHFDERYLHIELEDGRIISTPIAWYPELQQATLNQISHYHFICRGTGIEWPDLDYHLSIESMFVESRETKAA
jgi:hypothetical protein